MKPTRNQILIGSGLVLAGLLLGWILFSGPAEQEPEDTGHDHEQEMVDAAENGGPEDGEVEVWTCSMHPSVREDEPGQCPICGMDLIPASSEESEGDYSMVMTASAVELAEVRTAPVVRDFPERMLRLPGRIKVDERRITNVTAHFPGRIIETNVDFTGAPIRKGEPMATVYSPELITAQRELIEAANQRERNPRLYESARQKFRFWEFSDQQIDEIISRGEVQREMEILSPVDGFVMSRNVADEQHVMEGSVIYEVANLEHLWVVLEAYEGDLEWISTGDEIQFASRGNPGNTRTTSVSYIDPVVDPAKRTAGIRADIENNNFQLKPDMLVTGTIRAEMPEEKLMVPASSVLWTGPRSLVYVRDTGADNPRFEVREVKLGHRAGDHYVIEEGVREGEQVVFNGAFRIDSEFQLADRFSMMNREPGSGAVPGHDHGDMDDPPAREPESGGNDHDDPGMAEGDASDEAGQTPDEHGEAFAGATEEFRNDFLELLDHYLDGKEALVASDFESTREAFQQTADELEAIDMHRMEGDAHVQWMEQYEAIDGHLNHILEAGDIEGQREGFAQLSLILIEAVRNYEIPGVIYHQYCPMVEENWLSSEEQIANPYEPEAMLRCGEVIERMDQ